jgi:DNA-binding beta-propeller fold protein YncE
MEPGRVARCLLGMTTRRTFLTLAGGVAAGGAVLLAGCGRRVHADPAVPDPVLVDTDAGLALLRGSAAQVLGAGVPTLGGTAIYTATATGAGTVLRRVETRTGQASAETPLPGRWVPRVVAPDDAQVALTAPGGDRYRPVGRDRTTILVAAGGGVRHKLELSGNYEPDAFAREGTGLFVLEWLPPTAPDRYRVRLVDLPSGRFTEMLTREKQPVPVGTEEQMRGQGRQAVTAPGGQTLYTLYTRQPGAAPVEGGWDTESPGFVHTLDTSVGWAYCLDLPDPFGTGPAAAHTIALTPDGRHLLVADLSTGHLAIADTETLKILYVLEVPNGTGTAYSAVSADGKRLYLGIGADLHVVNLDLLNTVARWDAGGEVRGLALSGDGSRLLVGYPGAVGWCGAGDGAPQGRVPVPGLIELRQCYGALAG